MKKKNKILGLDLDRLIQESIRGLLEGEDATQEDMKEKLRQQKSIASKKKRQKVYSGKDGEAGDEAPEGITPEKPVKLKHEKIPDINPKALKDRIDNIRAGKSLKDAETYAALKSYFEKLNGPERVALYAFLTGLEKILGQQDDNAKPPHAQPYSIDMEQDKEIETGKKPKSSTTGTKEISSTKKSETPIVVGERADTRSIKSKLWR